MHDEVKIIDEISIVAIPLILNSYNNKILGAATGFFWRGMNGRTFLVSNHHVFSGNHYITGMSTRNDSAFPVKLLYPRIFSMEKLEERVVHEVVLCDQYGNEPKWRSHPKYNDNPVDIGVVEVPSIADDGSYVYAVNDNPLRESEKSLPRYKPGFEMMIAGFFLKDRPTGYFPVYIRGSVASEMDALYRGKRAFLIDALTSRGMSGSPVFAVGAEVNDPNQKFGGGFKIVPRFVGVYSGRIIEHENGMARELQVGIVWRRELIQETVEQA